MIDVSLGIDKTATVTFIVHESISAIAGTIHLVGDFNGWNESDTPMTRPKHHQPHQVTLTLETGKCYEFRYLADGRVWHCDWGSPDKEAPAPYSGKVSVVDLSVEALWKYQ